MKKLWSIWNNLFLHRTDRILLKYEWRHRKELRGRKEAGWVIHGKID